MAKPAVGRGVRGATAGRVEVPGRESEAAARVGLVSCSAMAAIPEELVAVVVKDVSSRMENPQYAQLAVGQFVQAQPVVSQYLSAKSEKLGGEGVIHTAFHGELLSECFRRYHAREELPVLGFEELDQASQGDTAARFRELEPALADYVASNVDEDEVKKVLALVAVALHQSF